MRDSAGEAAGRPRRALRPGPARRRVDDAVHAARVDRACSRRWPHATGAPSGRCPSSGPAPASSWWPGRCSTGGRTSAPSASSTPSSGATATGARSSRSRPTSCFGSGEGPPLPTVFIRAPLVVSVGDDGRRPGHARRRPRAGAPGAGAGIVVPSRAHGGPPGPPPLRGDVRVRRRRAGGG